MTEFKPPISQMMGELEIEAAELYSENFKKQTEQIKNELQKKMLRNLIDVFCTIRNAGVLKHLDWLGDGSKGNQLLDLAFDKLSEKEYKYLVQMTRLLDASQANLSQFRKAKKRDTFNIYKEFLNDNVILPNPKALSQAASFGFRNLIIVPGEMTIKEIIKNRPNYFDILIEDPVRRDKTITAERPKKFYTLALPECKESTQAYPALELGDDGGKGWLDKVKQEFRNDRLDVTGLTIKEYILLQFYLVRQQISQGLGPEKIVGFDSDSKCLLVDDININGTNNRTYPTIGEWFDNKGGNRGVKITRAAHMENFRKLPQGGARLAVNFSGDQDE